MPFRSANIATKASYLIAAVLSAAFVLVILGRPDFVAAQQARHPQATAKNGDQATRIARGQYIVEGVAVADIVTRPVIRTAIQTTLDGSKVHLCFMNPRGRCKDGRTPLHDLPACHRGATRILLNC